MSERPEKEKTRTQRLQIVFPFGEASDEAEAIEKGGSADPPRPEASEATVRSRSESKRNETAERSAPPRKRKWFSLYDKVFALPNLQAAWERTKANGGAPGSDGVTIRSFDRNARERLEELSEDLRGKTYRPKPVRRVFIPKSGGGRRPPGIPSVRDRIVQQAIHQVLSPIFEERFDSRSHGFRPGRGCATALEVADRAVRHGYAWVVDADVERFFETVDHEKLLTALNEEIADGSVSRLIRMILEAGVVEPGADEIEPTDLGTPQGGPLSPLLANVYLHAFDLRMHEAGFGMVRYADDFILFARSESEAEAALILVREILEEEWGLRLHPEKTRVGTVDAGFEFLGFHYFRDPKTGQLRKEARRKSARRFREAIRRRTPRLRGQRKPKERAITPERLARNVRLKETIGEVNRYLVGWHWRFKSVWSGYPKTPFRDFDGYVRARMRAAITGRTGPGWWNRRLPNALLKRLGLISLDDLQAKYREGHLKAPARKGALDGEPYAGNPHVRFGKAGGGATSP